MTQGTIKTATAAEADAVIAVVVLAFSADPAARWAYSDPQQYLTHFPSFVSVFGGNAFAHASAYYVDGYVGTALWLPPEVHPDEARSSPCCNARLRSPCTRTFLPSSSRWATTTRGSRIGICRSLVSTRLTRGKGTARRYCSTP